VTGGQRVVQETRLWDAAAGRTMTMRSKEEAHDYRYFPEPDLPPLVIDSERISVVRDEMPELPDAMRDRFAEEYALPAYDAKQLTQTRALAEYFEATIRSGAPPKLASNWIMGEVARKLKEVGGDTRQFPLSPERLAGLLALVGKETISGPSAKAVFEKM